MFALAIALAPAGSLELTGTDPMTAWKTCTQGGVYQFGDDAAIEIMSDTSNRHIWRGISNAKAKELANQVLQSCENEFGVVKEDISVTRAKRLRRQRFDWLWPRIKNAVVDRFKVPYYDPNH